MLVQVYLWNLVFFLFLSLFLIFLVILLTLNHLQGDTNNTLNDAVNHETMCLYQELYHYRYITKFPHFNIPHAMLKLI